MSLKSAGGGWGKNVALNISAFCLFDDAVPLSVGMNVVVELVSIYFLSFQIVVPSASFTNVLHVSSCAFLIIFLYSFSDSFHSSSSSSALLPLGPLRCLFLSLFTSFCFSVRSSFHHLLLNGLVSFRGVEHWIAFLMASVMSFASRSTDVGVGGVFAVVIFGRYSSSLAFILFQSILS